jgi:hypothetical protein
MPDLKLCYPSAPAFSRECKQRHVACSFNRSRQDPLMPRAGSRFTSGAYLLLLIDESLEQINLFVVN